MLEPLANLDRRDLLLRGAQGFGALALWGMLARSSRSATATEQPPPRAKSVIFLYMDGGPSQLDTFDPKPRLAREHGQKIGIPIVNRLASNTVLKSPFRFARHGQSGADVSELFPHVAQCVDDLAIIRSMVADNMEHGTANLLLNSGSSLAGRPSMGSWISYGLGSGCEDLPDYLVLHGGKLPQGGTSVFSNGFLPSRHQCSVFAPGDPKPFGSISRWEPTAELQTAKLTALDQFNRLGADARGALAELEGVAQNYELAARLQTALPELLDYHDETATTLQRYGIDQPETQAFGVECLLARKLVEKGVRFVTLLTPVLKADRWDQHANLEDGHRRNALATDKPIAGLLQDLKARGLLDQTVVLWGGEFGRTPTAEFQEGRAPGREHNPHGFTMWLAGGGVRGGIRYGATDEYGYRAVENPVHVHDLHATLLHLLGIDHTQLTFRHGGRDYRLTDVYGRVVHDLLA